MTKCKSALLPKITKRKQKIMIIDVHAHLNDEMFDQNREEIIASLKTDGVEKVVNAGCDLQTCKQVLDLSKKYDNLFCVLGVHPEFCETYSEEMEKFIVENSTNPKVVGIGEIGLDYHFTTENKDTQKQVFIAQIKLAHKLKLPIVVHLRDCYGDALEIFKQNKQYLEYGVCLHCFSGSPEFYKEIEKLGIFISIGGSVTFKNNQKGTAVAQIVDRQKFMLETDCPYLSPEPFRGKLNQPKNIIYVASKLADLWYISSQEVIEMAKQNSLCFFKKLKD